MKKVAIIITAHCAGRHKLMQEKMTETLSRELSKLSKDKYYICLATHTPLGPEIQQYCDGYVYDSDNSFQINGLPEQIPGRKLSHGMAELKLIHDALNYLERFDVAEHFLKLTYDVAPNLDFNNIINNCQQVLEHEKKSFITSNWESPDSLGLLMFYSHKGFFRKTLSLGTPELWYDQIEKQFYNHITSMNLWNQVYVTESYNNFLGCKIKEYSHGGGRHIEHYPFAPMIASMARIHPRWVIMSLTKRFINLIARWRS